MSFSVFGGLILLLLSCAATVNALLIFIEHLATCHPHVHELTLILPKTCQVNTIIPNLQIRKHGSDEDDDRIRINFAHLINFPSFSQSFFSISFNIFLPEY